MKLLAAVLIISSSLFAQDFTGRWTGVADTTDEGGTHRMEKHTFEIKMEGGKLVGVQLGRAGGPLPLQVQTDGAKVDIYRFQAPEGGEHLRWKLELKDGKLVGTYSSQHNGPKKWVFDRVGAATYAKEDASATATK